MSRRRPLDWLWVLGVPFIAFGLTIAGVALYFVAAEAGWPTALGVAAFGLVFVALGASGVIKSVRENKRTMARNRMRRKFPDEPWRWRPEWATGRIPPEAPGTTILELATIPAPVGGTMRGGVVIPFGDDPAGDVVVTLSATRIFIESDGKRRTSHRDLLWEASYTVPLEGVPAGMRADVVFDIPADAPPTNDDHPNDEIVWRLKAASTRSGEAYSATFVVPVF